MRRTPEHEAKLLVGPDYVLPELGDVVPGGTVRLFPDERLEATYFDTRDHRLAGWGVTLRWRVDGGDQGRWTLKLPAGLRRQWRTSHRNAATWVTAWRSTTSRNRTVST